MTEEKFVLAELLEKVGEGDFLRAVAEAVLQLLMETDVEGIIGAGRYRSKARHIGFARLQIGIGVLKLVPVRSLRLRQWTVLEGAHR